MFYYFLNPGNIAEYLRLHFNEFQRFTPWIVTYFDFNVVQVYIFSVPYCINVPHEICNNLPQGHVFRINAHAWYNDALYGCIVHVMLWDIIYSTYVPIFANHSSWLTVLEEKLWRCVKKIQGCQKWCLYIYRIIRVRRWFCFASGSFGGLV